MTLKPRIQRQVSYTVECPDPHCHWSDGTDSRASAEFLWNDHLDREHAYTVDMGYGFVRYGVTFTEAEEVASRLRAENPGKVVRIRKKNEPHWEVAFYE